MDNCIVEALDVWKRYRGGAEALRGTSLRAWGLTAIMGPNGSGKSTLLAILAGALRPSQGRVSVCGYDPWGEGAEEARALVAYSPQDPPFPREVTSLEALIVTGILAGVPVGEARSRARAALEEVDLLDAAGVRVSRLSGGQRRRLGIALALMLDALVLLLDEPGSGLDPRARDRLLETLRRLATRGMTIVFTTHDPGEAELADRVAVMHMGKVVIEGAPRELIARYAPKPRVRVKAPRHPSSLKARRLVAGLAEYEVEDEREAGLVAKVYSDEGIPIEWLELARPGLREVFYEVTGERLE